MSLAGKRLGLTIHQHCASASLQIIQNYGIPHHIPLCGSTTYANIAENIGKDVQASLVERVVRHAMTYGLFCENDKGDVEHNATSALLVNDPNLEVSLTRHTFRSSHTNHPINVGMAFPLHQRCLPCWSANSQGLGAVRIELRGQRIGILCLDRQQDFPVPTLSRTGWERIIRHVCKSHEGHLSRRSSRCSPCG